MFAVIKVENNCIKRFSSIIFVVRPAWRNVQYVFGPVDNSMSTCLVQVNAAGHNERTVRVEVPRTDDSEGPRSVLVNVVMEPTTATTVESASDDEHYTYHWTSNSVDATDRTAVAADGEQEPNEADREAADYDGDRTDYQQHEDDNDFDLRFLPVSTWSGAADRISAGRRIAVTSAVVYLVSQLVTAVLSFR